MLGNGNVLMIALYGSYLSGAATWSQSNVGQALVKRLSTIAVAVEMPAVGVLMRYRSTSCCSDANDGVSISASPSVARPSVCAKTEVCCEISNAGHQFVHACSVGNLFSTWIRIDMLVDPARVRAD